MDIVVYLLISLSLSQLWSHSKIFSYIRIFLVKIPLIRDALLCPVCSSFWIGLFVSLFLNPLLPFFSNIIISSISCAVINYGIFGILLKFKIFTDD